MSGLGKVESRNPCEGLFIHVTRSLLLTISTISFLCGTAIGIGPTEKPDIKFDNYTIREGLSQSTVNCITQDSLGFIWVGTQDGLNRFNGYEFTIFRNDPLDTTSLSNNYINSIIEGRNGMLWVGTDQGLNLLERGEQIFEPVPLGKHAEEAPSTDQMVWALEKGPNGDIWIGTAQDGLFHYLHKEDTIVHVDLSLGRQSVPSISSIRSLYCENGGAIWIGTAGNGLLKYHPEKGVLDVLSSYRVDDRRLENDMIWCVTSDGDRGLWVGTNKGLHHIRSGERKDSSKVTAVYQDLDKSPFSLSNNVIRSVFVDSRNRTWIGTAGGGLNKMVERKDTTVFVKYGHNEYIQSSLANDLVYAIFEDRTGSIWVGSNRGLSKFDPGKQNFKHITSRVNSSKGLRDKNVWSISQEKDHILWVGTREGITRIDRKKDEFHHYEREGKVNDQSILSIHIGENIWVGAVDGLFKLELGSDTATGEFVKVPYRPDDPNAPEKSKVYCIEEGKDGYLWVGTRDGLSRIHKGTGEFTYFRSDPDKKGGLSHNTVRDVYRDPDDGTIWVATDGGGLNKLTRKKGTGDTTIFQFEHFKSDPRDDNTLSTDMLLSIWEGTKGDLWIGTYGGGLNRFHLDQEKVDRFTEKDGLSNNVVYGVLGDGSGNLWMSTNQGLSKFDIDKGTFRVYEESDGIQSNEFNIGAFHKSDNGELFFGGINGLNAFYPGRIETNPHPPRMVFTKFKLFNEVQKPGEEGILTRHISVTRSLTLSHDQDNFTIVFAALHFSSPGKNKYKYFMKGFDKDTILAGTDRTAHYTNMDPGTYTFKVFGSNSDGKWSKEPAELKIRIEPPFWATWWFRGGAVLSILGVIFGMYRYRVNLIKSQKRKLEVEVWNRTREVTRQKERIVEQNKQLEEEKQKVEQQKSLLQEEKEKVDKLLMNILPEDTANELKTGGKASARHYRMASVMFTDFKGFTKVAEKMKPTELVARLDSYFIKFDKIIEKWELEKIKTIGDSYMCAGGIPIRNKTNPVHTVLAGLEIQQFMAEQRKNLEAKGEEGWSLRIGIHTGELIAGVIGIKRFAYDIWGDTVNVASRMETNSEVDRVNISGTTYQYIEPFFECTYRGKVKAKNKGHIDMFYVNRIKPELSIDGKGLRPNKAFWDYLNLHFFSKINYRKAEKSLLKKLRKDLPQDLYYHDVDHTIDVCQAVERIAFMEGIKGEDLFILKTAALFHDAGFIHQYENNEGIGVEMAKKMLPKYGYTQAQIEKIDSMIRATEVPQQPKDHLEEILCDADLDYLGRSDFHKIADKLRKELMERGKIQSMIEWDELQIKFLTQHTYFTESSIKLRQKKKEKHIREIRERLERMKKEGEPNGTPSSNSSKGSGSGE